MPAARASLFAAGIVLVAMGLGGCQTSSGVSQPAMDFVAAAGALTQAESDYFDQIQAASDAGHRLDASDEYVSHSGEFVTIYAKLQHRDDFSKAKQIRVAALTQLQNYAAQVNAIAGGASAPWISDDAKSISSQVTTLASDAAGVKLNAATVGLVQSAVTDLGQDIIDSRSATELQTLAKAATGPIGKIATMIQQDNEDIEKDNFASGLVADQSTDLEHILKVIYADEHVNSAGRFAAIQTVVNWKATLVTKGADIQAALKKLQTANDALAAGSKTSNLDTLWQQAQGLAQAASGTSTAGK